VSYVLASPDRSKPDGARDYALLLPMLRTSLRVAEACSLKASSIRWSHGRWTLKFKVKVGSERTIPLPREVKEVIDEYLYRQVQMMSGHKDPTTITGRT
jgi:integrase